MTTRTDVVHEALRWNGNGNGEGYPGHQNPFSQHLGRPNEFWCGDFVTDIYKRVGLALPSMQPGCRTGYAYCPDAVNYGRSHHCVVNSWDSKPGDIWLFDWNGNGEADHTEIFTGRQGSTAYTIGGDSGPSTVDNYRAQGGVHRHMWSDPSGTGNRMVIAVLNADKLVDFSAAPKPHKPVTPPSENPRSLMLKSPMMHGKDVESVQNRLNHLVSAGLKVDGIYGRATRDAVMHFQKKEHLSVDGIVGPHTRKAMGLE